MRLQFLLSTLLVLPSAAFTGQGPAPARDPGVVVFVCEHGSVKSLIATSWFNRRAAERGLSYRAIARGTSPDSAVPPMVQQGLGSDGFDVRHFVPRRFESSDLAGARLVVSFDQDVAGTVGGRVPWSRWDGLPAVSSDFALGRAAIVARVDSLVTQLAQQPDSLIIDVEGRLTVRRTLAGLPRDTLSVGFHGGPAERFAGVSVQALLESAGLAAGGAHGASLARYVVVECRDGYRVVFGLAELDTSIVARRFLLADSTQGHALAGNDGPWRLVAGGDLRGARSARQVTAIRVREAGR